MALAEMTEALYRGWTATADHYAVASRSKLILGGFKKFSTEIRPIMAALELR